MGGWRVSLLLASALALLVLRTPAWAGELHDAAGAGNVEELKRLLDTGLSLEERDGTKETPLISAARAGQAPVVDVLVKRGADLMARNDRGMTALHAASYGGSLASVKLLVDAGSAVNDADDKFKVTPLIIASEENHLDVVEFLLEHGADVNQAERHGYTALSRAGFKRHWDVVQLLLKNGGQCQSAKVAGDGWALECAIQVIKEVTGRTGGSP